MKTILKITAICLPLFFTIPASAHLNLGIDLRFGTPPPHHEVMITRPYANAIWVPGYYNYYPGHRYAWSPGFWRRPERVEHRDYREHEVRERFSDRGNDHDHQRNNADSHRGRIR